MATRGRRKLFIEAVLELLAWLVLAIVEAVAEWLIAGLVWKSVAAIGWRGVLLTAAVAAGLVAAVHLL